MKNIKSVAASAFEVSRFFVFFRVFGIDDGDYVIVRKTNTADYGKIVVALDNDNRNTLKRLEFDSYKKRPYLHPENKMYKDIYPTELSI